MAYYYVVSAVSAGGESAYSAEVSATPTLGVPNAPTGLAATPGDNQVALSWTAPAVGSPTSYNVKRSITSGSGYTDITTPGAQTTTSYTDSTAVNGTTYYYVVSSVNATGEGDNSSQVSAAPLAFMNAYEPFNYATGNLVNNTVATGTGLMGNWTCGANGTIGAGLTYPSLPTGSNALSSSSARQVVSFTTPLARSGTKWISFLMKHPAGDLGTNKRGVYLANGGTGLFFGYGVTAFSGSQGYLALCSINSVGTAATGTTTTFANTFLGTFATTYLVVMSIEYGSPNDTVKVYINPTAGQGTAPAANYTVTTFNVGTITGIGLNVQAGAITVDEIRTGETYGSVVGYNPPATPTGLVATPGVNSVSLSWNAVSGATGYKVLRGTTTGVYNATNSVASNTNYDATAIGGTTYFYAVQATNASGPSAISAEVSATPTIALPNVPTGLIATGSNSVVNLSWSLATGAASYNVKRSTTSGAEVTIATVGTTNYADSAVVNGTPYFYKVSSTNAAGESADSSEVTATPDVPPLSPTGLTATAGDNQVALAWTGSAGAASYNVKRSTVSGSGYTTIGTTTAPTVAYTDTTAIKFTEYFYVVSAVSAYGESPNSSPEANATPTGAYGPTAYEPFNYSAGSFANNTPSTAAGFTGNWAIPTSALITTDGMTYSGLPTTNRAYQHVATSSQNTVALASPLSSGTKYISYLFKGSGNSGGDAVGIFLKGNNATSLFAGFRAPDSATTTGFGLGTVNSTTLGGPSALGGVINLTNTATYFIVIKIDFNTSGNNDTVTLWINPAVNALTPGTPVGITDSTFDVGTISAFGINITGGYAALVDEVRIGDVYGDVVGYGVPISQTITFGALADKTYGDAGFALGATASSGLPVSYTSSHENVATVTGNAVTVVGVGTTTITASQAGNGSYSAAPSVPQTLTVHPRAVTLSGSRGYDATTTAAAAILTVDNNLDGANLTLSGSATLASANGGLQTISAFAGLTLGGSAAAKYTLAGASGSVRINPTPGVFTVATTKNTAVTFNTNKLILVASDAGVVLSITSVTSPSAHGTVTIGGTTITYTPDTDYVGADSFTYTLSDDAGGSSVGTVNVTVRAANVSSTITDLVVVTGVSATLTASGQSGHMYNVQASDNAGSTWSTIGSATAAANGVIIYTDTTPNPDSRLYRLAQ